MRIVFKNENEISIISIIAHQFQFIFFSIAKIKNKIAPVDHQYQRTFGSHSL